MEDIKNNYSSDEEVVKKPYNVTSFTKIGWGKLKGLPHSEFLKKENANYTRWVVNQGDEFRYNNSRNWILQNLEIQYTEDINVVGNKPIKDLTFEQIEDWVKFGLRK